jgi:flagellar basal-body rod modification protein FlgD
MSTVDNTKNAALINSLGLGQPQPQRTASTELGQDQFLSLMIAQLKNQDPMQPMQNGEFLSQMAQFGTVSGIQDLQKSFGSLASSLQSNQALMATSLVGRAVLVPGSQLPFAGAPAGAAAELPQAAADVRVTVLDASGQVVRQFALGAQAAGTVRFTWDGLNNAGATMPAGSYTIKAEAINGTTTSALATNVVARVDSVSLGGQQGITLNLWDGTSKPLSDVKELA